MQLSSLSRAVALLASLGTTYAQQVKFMPLGDSITEITCWRGYVWDQFSAAGLASQVDFVGSVNNNVQNCVTQSPNFDTNHEGHSGFLSIDIANNYLQQWLLAAQPDVVQYMLGTNDVAQGRTTDDIIASYTKMVGLMRASNPNMKIIVDKVIPLASNGAGIDQLNARIPAWVASMTTAASPIMIADCSTTAGFTTAMLRDGVHPNDQGDQVIASNVGPVVIQAVKDVIAARV